MCRFIRENQCKSFPLWLVTTCRCKYSGYQSGSAVCWKKTLSLMEEELDYEFRPIFLRDSDSIAIWGCLKSAPECCFCHRVEASFWLLFSVKWGHFTVGSLWSGWKETHHQMFPICGSVPKTVRSSELGTISLQAEMKAALRPGNWSSCMRYVGIHLKAKRNLSIPWVIEERLWKLMEVKNEEKL